MSQDNTNTNTNTDNNTTTTNNIVEEKFVNNEQSGWSSGSFPTIDLNFDVDEDEINDALVQEQKKKRGKKRKRKERRTSS